MGVVSCTSPVHFWGSVCIAMVNKSTLCQQADHSCICVRVSRQQCWQQDPLHRPAFKSLENDLEDIATRMRDSPNDVDLHCDAKAAEPEPVVDLPQLGPLSFKPLDELDTGLGYIDGARYVQVDNVKPFPTYVPSPRLKLRNHNSTKFRKPEL